MSELKLPELGEGIETAIVGSVLVAAGDRVEVDQALVEVETDKATAEVPAEAAGVVREVRVEVGDEIHVGAVLVVLEGEAATAAEPSPAVAALAAKEGRSTAESASAPDGATAGRPARTEKPTVSETAGSTAEAGPSRSHVPAAPGVRRLARELGVDVASVPGSGPHGRIFRDDVKAYVKSRNVGTTAATAASAPMLPDFTPWTEVRREPMSTIRRKTAENLTRAWTTIPHVTQFDEADVTDLLAMRRQWAPTAEERGAKLTVTAIVLKVTAAALREFPRFNASVDMARHEIVFKEAVHIGVAADTDRGLLVPVVRDADAKSILDIAVDLTDLSARARDGKLAIDEMRGATFTVSNLGGLGTTHFSPIINWPEVAILGVGRATERVLPRDGVFQARRILPLSISYDHRVIDGADAARFLRWVAEALEQPMRLLLG